MLMCCCVVFCFLVVIWICVCMCLSLVLWLKRCCRRIWILSIVCVIIWLLV